MVWDSSHSHECVALRDVVLDVRVGLRDAEKVAPQPIRVDVELYRRRGGGPVGDFADCLDYDRVFRHLTEAWPPAPHTELLEELAERLVAFCLEDARVEACRVVLRKPAIYLGRAVPSLEVYRRRDG